MSTVIPIRSVGADLVPFQYRAISIAGTLATGPLNAVGLSQTRVSSGEDGSAMVMGRGRFIAGGAIPAGGRIKVSPGGFMTSATSGDTSCGFCEITVTSGSVGRGLVNLVSQTYHVSSNG